jgi:hypothetical protein
MVSPSAYAGQSVEFKASLAVGKIVTPFGERTKLVSHSWEYPPGTKHSIGAPADVPEGRCIFLAKGDGGAPAFPLQVIVTDSLTPCMAGSVPQLLVGKVGGVEDVKLIVNDQPSIVKALTLSEPALKTPN